MEKVESYKTSDGVLFEDKKEAEKHEAELSFDHWYLNNELLGNYAGSRVELNDMKEWLFENKTVICAFLGCEDK